MTSAFQPNQLHELHVHCCTSRPSLFYYIANIYTDADLANNSASWQWVAGCGADAAPYFRIFNPTGQGEKFDPHGDYVRRWVPEVAALPDEWLHKPWDAPAAVLKDAGLTLGRDYPKPIVDHKAARERALAALKETRA